MVDEKARADGGARVDVDAGGAVRQLGHQPRQQRHAQLVQLVRQPVVDDGVDAGVAQQHLVHAVGRRVALVGGQHVGVEQAPDARQGESELVHDVCGAQVQVTRRQVLCAVAVAQLQPHLRGQGAEHLVQRVADVEVLGFLAQFGRAQAHGEQHPAQAIDDFDQHLARGQVAPAQFDEAVLRGPPFAPRLAQFGHHVADVE